jgi:hypothetical protein
MVIMCDTGGFRCNVAVLTLTNRRHCANKLHRLRQVTGTTNGKGKTFKKAPGLTGETVKDVK